MSARALWIIGPRQAQWRDELLPPLPPGHVRVRALHGAISRGTESLVFEGRVPASEYERMRCPFQAGRFPAPVKYGYISVGCIEGGPQELLGRRVFCLHPHQTVYQVPAEAVVPLPEGVPAARAVLAANLETAVNALWDAAPRVGDRISVIGAGTLGLLVAWLAARMPGTQVEVVDVLAERAAAAQALGASFALPAQAARERDLVVHCSGQGEGLAMALELAGMEATVLELSWYGTQRVELPLGEAFHARRLSIRSSQVGQVAAAQRARWSHRRRMELAMALLHDDRLDCLITDAAPADELPAVLARLASGQSRGTLCHRIDYPAAAR